MHMLDITPIVLVILCTSHEAWEYFEDWGWKKTQTMYLPIRTTELIYCTCTTTNCGKKCGCKKAGLRCSRSCKNCLGETYFNPADITEKNNREDDDNLEDLEYVDEETVGSEYIVKPGYLQVIRGTFDDGSDDELEITMLKLFVTLTNNRKKYRQIKNHRHRTASLQENAERGNKLVKKI
ncbi:hypothetical protein JTB14_032395 [Gonioctena quinquepunctata]|nr:hypothetical protein JTB14_032395 [Gonioctena quinquepunctata]